jgi:hypothetical protein
MVKAALGDVVADDPVVERLVQLLADEGTWTGTAAGLHGLDAPWFGTPGWPRSPEAMGKWLTRSAGALAQLGIVATMRRTARARVWTLELVSASGHVNDGSPKPSSQPSSADHLPDLHSLLDDDGCDGCDSSSSKLEGEREVQGRGNSQEEVWPATVIPSQPSRTAAYQDGSDMTVWMTDTNLTDTEAVTGSGTSCDECKRPLTANPDLVSTGAYAVASKLASGLCVDCSLVR